MVIQAQVIRDLKTSVKGVESVEAAFCSLTRRSNEAGKGNVQK